MQPPEQNVSRNILTKSIHGGAWLTAGFIVQKTIGFISFVILGRLLLPSDFGILVLMLLVPKFLESASDAGLSKALIQDQGNVERYLNPLWTFGILKSAAVAVIVFFGGPLIASYLHAEHAILAIRLGGLFMLIQSFSNIGEIFFFKELDFKKVFVRNVCKDLAYTIVGIMVVFATRSYWALVAATTASYFTQAISTYILHPYRPRFTFRFAPLWRFFGYSKWIVGQNWSQRIYGFLESTILARTLDVNNLGLFSKAKSLAGVAPGLLGPMFNLVSFPTYAKLQEEPTKIRDGFIKSLNLLFFILVPVIFLVIVAGGKLILIILGPSWLPMTNALRVLLLFLSLSISTDITQAILNALGRPKTQTSLSFISLLVTIPLLVPFTMLWGITGSAIAILVGLLPILILSYKLLASLTALTLRDVGTSLALPLVVSTILFLPTIIWKEALLALPTPALLGFAGSIGILYGGVILFIGLRFNYGPYPILRLIWNTLKPRA